MKDVTFTPAQQQAVDVSAQDVDVCVVAGPGSGKTTVLVEYFRRLVAAGTDPARILAITFTEKAAANMRKKLAEVFNSQPEIRARLERAWVSTVHGFCGRVLRENAVFAGIDPEFYVAGERESWRLQRESINGAIEELFASHPASVRALIRGLSAFDFEEALLNAYDGMRGAGVSVEDLARFPLPAAADWSAFACLLRDLRTEPFNGWNGAQKQNAQEAIEAAERVLSASGPIARLQALQALPRNLNKCKRNTAGYNLLSKVREFLDAAAYSLITGVYAADRDFLVEIIRRFDSLYRERKRQAGALDFADLEEFTVRLMEHDPASRERIRSQFDHILMDEFQDTNGQQAKLLDLVRTPGRFYAVGDINQSIFGFRHAEPQGFSTYRQQVSRHGGRLVDLRENFRSRAEILGAVEAVMGGQPGIEPRPLVAGREFATPRTNCVEAASFELPEQEAQWLAQRVLDLSSEFPFGEMAVLVRNTEAMADITTAFDAAGIPYVVSRGRGFFETREVNDLTHLLRVIANPNDEISLAVVLRSPLVAVSDDALLALRLLGDNIGAALLRLDSASASQFAPEDYSRLCGFRDRLRKWREHREYASFDRLLGPAIDECGYPYAAGSRASANIDKFVALAREAASRGSLDQFVVELAQVRADNPREQDAPPEDAAEAVKVMTVHSAKGLEFPVVFVAALHKGVDTSAPAVAFEPHIGLGARWRNPAGRDDKDDLVQHALREKRKEREQHESNRLLYVAMTRAEQHLGLSYSGQPANWAKLVVQSGLPVQTPALPAVPAGASRLAVNSDSTEYLAPPTVTQQCDTNATVTALASFWKCPRQYYLGHYLGVDARPRRLDSNGILSDTSAAGLGTQVHALLAGNQLPDAEPEALRLAGVFRKNPLGRRLERATRSAREVDFLLSVEELVIHGQIDLWFEEGGELVMVDYKTDAVNGMEAHQRASEYALQLRLYAAALEKSLGRLPDHAYLHFLRPDTLVEVDVTPSLLDSPEQVVREFQDAQETMKFGLNEGPHCRRCQFFRDLCPSAVQ